MCHPSLQNAVSSSQSVSPKKHAGWHMAEYRADEVPATLEKREELDKRKERLGTILEETIIKKCSIREVVNSIT